MVPVTKTLCSTSLMPECKHPHVPREDEYHKALNVLLDIYTACLRYFYFPYHQSNIATFFGEKNYLTLFKSAIYMSSTSPQICIVG